MWKWFFGKKTEGERPMEARLPGQGSAGHGLIGRLETLSPTWVFVSEYAKEEIADLRRSNDRMLDADRTAAIRGQIKALRKLLELEQGPGNRPKRLPADYASLAGEEDDY